MKHESKVFMPIFRTYLIKSGRSIIIKARVISSVSDWKGCSANTYKILKKQTEASIWNCYLLIERKKLFQSLFSPWAVCIIGHTRANYSLFSATISISKLLWSCAYVWNNWVFLGQFKTIQILNQGGMWFHGQLRLIQKYIFRQLFQSCHQYKMSLVCMPLR